jgi:hypothetical protein
VGQNASIVDEKTHVEDDEHHAHPAAMVQLLHSACEEHCGRGAGDTSLRTAKGVELEDNGIEDGPASHTVDVPSTPTSAITDCAWKCRSLTKPEVERLTKTLSRPTLRADATAVWILAIR